MKQNITLAIDNELLKRARALAAQLGTSLGGLLEDTLRSIDERETEFEQAKRKALAQLSSPFRLGGRTPNRESLHDRESLR